MRVNVFVSGPALKTALVAAAFGGVIAASCSFNPAPAGSATGQGSGYGGSGPLGVANSTGQTGGSNATGAGGSGSGSGPTPSPDGKNCGAVQVGLENVPPDLLIVLDKSGSMARDAMDKTCGRTCTSKWTSTTTAINMVVGQTQATIRWGLKYFANDDSCGVTDGAAVMVAPNNATAIANSIMRTRTGGNTPTEAGVTSAVKYMQGLTDPNPKYILLATDGEPNCMPGNADPMADDADGAVAAVTAAATAGFPVYVVGVGNLPDAQATLNRIATAGGRPQAGATSYYPVSSTDELVAVLTKIGGQIATCTFSLPSVPPVPTNVGVYADGDVNKKIPQDTTHTNGWDYGTGMRSIELFGTACDNIKNKVYKDVQAIFGCPGMIIP
jgi:hypothetical protein